MENINSSNNQIHNEASMSTTDLLIQALTAHFNDNPSNFTSYRSNIDQLLKRRVNSFYIIFTELFSTCNNGAIQTRVMHNLT